MTGVGTGKRLLLVGTNPNARGTEQHMVALGKQLHEDGHDVAVAAVPGGFIHESFGRLGVEVVDLRIRNSLDAASAANLVRAARRVQPEWVVGWFGKEYWPVLAAGRTLGARVALFKHLYPSMSPLTRRFVPRLADRFIVVSEAMREAAVARGVPAELVCVLPNPIDTRVYRPDPGARERKRAELGVAPDEVLVGFVGGLQVGKGIFTLLEAVDSAMAADPRIRALWLGTGPARDDLLARMAPATRNRHLLFGFQRDIHHAYQAMDIATVPSTAMESFSRVSIEAQACGVPVLASRLGGIPETMDPGRTGRLLPPGDVAAWREAILDLAHADPMQRKEMGMMGARFVDERFSSPVIAARFLSLLAEGRPAD